VCKREYGALCCGVGLIKGRLRENEVLKFECVLVEEKAHQNTL